jgi:hypothetical protein
VKNAMNVINIVMNVISDPKSLNLFKNIAVLKSDSVILITKVKLTRKQYYSRMQLLMKAGLITRVNGKYYLTLFGKVIYNFHVGIETAISYYWKVKALDSILMSLSSSSNTEMPAEEQINLVNKLIDNDKIKEIIISIMNNSIASTAAAFSATEYVKQLEQQQANIPIGYSKQTPKVATFG